MWGREKLSENAVVLGKRHDNEILKVQNSLLRNSVVVSQAPRDASNTWWNCY